jgi:hypothetical protein
MMDIQEVANKLNGVQYGDEYRILTTEYCKELRRNGIVVVRGYSDDLTEFDGAISDEFGADLFHLNSKGLIRSDCEDDNCPYFEKILKEAKYYIKSLWCEVENYAWAYETNIPHITFDVMEDEDKYCRGIVFKLSDLEN